jgi:hypothetical protein
MITQFIQSLPDRQGNTVIASEAKPAQSLWRRTTFLTLFIHDRFLKKSVGSGVPTEPQP